MPRFRKKPIVVEATRAAREELIATLAGDTLARPGDWIIVGVKGERYPCQHEVFRETYEPADAEAEEYYREATAAQRIEDVIAERAVSVLNKALEVDAEAVSAFVAREIVCRPIAEGSPFESTVDGGRRLKLVGIINAIAGGELVRAVTNQHGQLVGFEREA